ncbi:HD domain-containing protein [Lysinibacillus irui]|uniref:HD domain-containing protein n=1 Tax=Lysinibacillus irui TaxID=2998077 RepID=A0ABU5NN69_9BACI|nr:MULTISPECIES: HD domain-containing protein [Lysinibacillus]MEA0552358.1 HD domain-containing protein [Lysinibacillus irui]MEA0563992.1 HD domain-containing protein [Lysinibacillus irui]MEA0977491.1 HD domain-containing protein [Lysinibacillus irui]MEA1043645.1 HD domain-containing protein [Lysinibacillus irui]
MNNLLDKVRDVYAQFDASHDFQHIERVYQNALAILQSEPTADAEVVKIAVLLHDVSDKKYTDSKEQEEQLIAELPLSEDKKQHIRDCIAQVSFNGGNELEATSLEAKIVRDADRLDAIGAIGIARTFAYGGAKGRKLYDKDEEARANMSESEYRQKNTSSVTHFYEKLLLLKDLMVTEKGKKMALERHQFMESFLQQLQHEIGQ